MEKNVFIRYYYFFLDQDHNPTTFQNRIWILGDGYKWLKNMTKYFKAFNGKVRLYLQRLAQINSSLHSLHFTLAENLLLSAPVHLNIYKYFFLMATVLRDIYELYC